jgi:tRNA threonylcarbamoyl adenosine modification protein (Sua5/YciO/YrdC/YwlC family)
MIRNGSYANEDIAEITKYIKKNKVVIMPSDTIYGFLARQSAADRVRQMKNRDEKPFLCLISEIKQLDFFDIDYESYREILDKNWPGNITFILNNRQKDRTYGVRMPAYDIVKRIIDGAGEPLLSTSVNVSGENPLNDKQSIVAAFGDKADLIVIDNDFSPQQASTIVSLTDGTPKILRQGQAVFHE